MNRSQVPKSTSKYTKNILNMQHSKPFSFIRSVLKWSKELNMASFFCFFVFFHVFRLPKILQMTQSEREKWSFSQLTSTLRPWLWRRGHWCRSGPQRRTGGECGLRSFSKAQVAVFKTPLCKSPSETSAFVAWAEWAAQATARWYQGDAVQHVVGRRGGENTLFSLFLFVFMQHVKWDYLILCSCVLPPVGRRLQWREEVYINVFLWNLYVLHYGCMWAERCYSIWYNFIS